SCQILHSCTSPRRSANPQHSAWNPPRRTTTTAEKFILSLLFSLPIKQKSPRILTSLWSGRRPRSIGGTRNIQLGIRRGGLPIELQIDGLIYFFNQMKQKSPRILTSLWSGRRDSNPQHSAWNPPRRTTT